MTERIRWEPTKNGGWTGHVGTMEPWAFQIFKTGLGYVGWSLTAQLPGVVGVMADDPEKLKAEAERLLSEFVSSLGAVWPDEGFDFGDEDGETLEVKYAPGRRVRYVHPDYGYPGEQEPAAELLVFGAAYTIATCRVGRSRTDLILEGIPGEWFNSVFFEPVDDNPEPGPVAGGEKEN